MLLIDCLSGQYYGLSRVLTRGIVFLKDQLEQYGESRASLAKAGKQDFYLWIIWFKMFLTVSFADKLVAFFKTTICSPFGLFCNCGSFKDPCIYRVWQEKKTTRSPQLTTSSLSSYFGQWKMGKTVTFQFAKQRKPGVQIRENFGAIASYVRANN